MQDAITLEQWTISSKRQKAIEEQANMEEREARFVASQFTLVLSRLDILRNSIEDKLLELGWEKKYFPQTYHSGWAILVRQPRELTPRSMLFKYFGIIIKPCADAHPTSLEAYSAETYSDTGAEQRSRASERILHQMRGTTTRIPTDLE